MVETETAKSFSLSLYDIHDTIVDNYMKANKIRAKAAAIQSIIEEFNKNKNHNMRRDAVIFILYPVIFCTFSLFCTISINNIIDLSYRKEYIFVTELELLQGIFSAIGFISVGILATCFVFFFNNLYNRGIYGD